jgi:hypothetical protein
VTSHPLSCRKLHSRVTCCVHVAPLRHTRPSRHSFPKRTALCNYLKQMPYQCAPSSADGGPADCNERNFK